jgi:hypothetical protein
MLLIQDLLSWPRKYNNNNNINIRYVIEPHELKKNSFPEKMKKKSSDTFSKLNNQAKPNEIIPRNNETLVYLIFRRG